MRIRYHQVFTISCVLPPMLQIVLSLGQVVATSRLAQKNIFCCVPKRITLAGKVRVACFDKTGTLTTSSLKFHGVHCVASDTKETGPFGDSITGVHQSSTSHFAERVLLYHTGHDATHTQSNIQCHCYSNSVILTDVSVSCVFFVLVVSVLIVFFDFFVSASSVSFARLSSALLVVCLLCHLCHASPRLLSRFLPRVRLSSSLFSGPLSGLSFGLLSGFLSGLLSSLLSGLLSVPLCKPVTRTGTVDYSRVFLIPSGHVVVTRLLQCSQ